MALVDRNCHKSIEQGLIVTGGIPQYMVRCRVLWTLSIHLHVSQMIHAIKTTDHQMIQ